MVGRLAQFVVGIAAFGVGVAMIVRARLGLGPWDVFHQGISLHTGLRLGTVNALVAVVVLLLWWPLRQRPGLGTLTNALLIGPAINLALDLIPPVGSLPVRVALLGGSVGIGTVAYAVGIGPLVQVFLPLVDLGGGDPQPDAPSTTARRRTSPRGR